MNWNYDYFAGKEKLTEDDIEDFEAHAEIMQDRDLDRIDRECNPTHNKSMQNDTNNGAFDF